MAEEIKKEEEAEVKKVAGEKKEAPAKVDAAKPAAAPVEAKPKPKLKRKRKTRKPGIISKAKKKKAISRATVKKGTGKIRINNRNIEVFQPDYVYRLLTDPLRIAGGVANEVDVHVTTSGGGFMGQVISARGAIAKALINYTKDQKLKQRMLAYDRTLLVDDARRTEPKKPLGPKARRKKQKSKR